MLFGALGNEYDVGLVIVMVGFREKTHAWVLPGVAILVRVMERTRAEYEGVH